MKRFRSTIRKMILVTLAVVLLTPGLLLSQSGAEDRNSGWSVVTVEVSLRRNTLIARHGVTIFLDGKQVRHLKQGELATLNLLVSRGDHRLLFVPDSEKSENLAWELSFLHDEYILECEIQTHRRFVEIKAHRVTADSRKLTEKEREEILEWAVELSDDVPFFDISGKISGKY